MVYVEFNKCSVWFLPALIFVLTWVTAASRVSTSEKYARHDKNWWFWNSEAKEKLGTLDDSQKKKEKETNKLESKMSAYVFKPTIDPLRSLLKNDSKTHPKYKKRWLSGSSWRKQLHKDSRKWLIDSQRSGVDILQTTPVIQDPWMVPQKRMKISTEKDNKTDIHFRQVQARLRATPRKHSAYTRKIPVHYNNDENGVAVNLDNILFRSFDHKYNGNNTMNDVHSEKGRRFSEQGDKTSRRPTPTSVFEREWNKFRAPIWNRYMTSYEELKFNPLMNPYPFHDPRSTIKWYTTPQYKLVRTSSAPQTSDQSVPNEGLNRKMLLNQNHAQRLITNAEEVIEHKGVAKFKDKWNKEVLERGHLRSEYDLIPKIYVRNQLRNRERGANNYNDRYGWFADSMTNPIIVPGFKRKYSGALDDSYFIRTKDHKAPQEEEDDFIQISRANRNRTNNAVTINENKVTGSGIPIQVPSPYAFPGGVNISILVPNPPAPSHETPLSTVTSSTDKNKKKKERKKKVKSDDESLEGLLSKPRSMHSARGNVRKLQYAGKTGINPLVGNDDRKISGMLRYLPCTTNTIEHIEYPISLKADNFSLLNHIRNLTLNQMDLYAPLLGMQNEKVKKPSEGNQADDDNDEDEIRMLYDEQRSSSTTLRSDEHIPYGQTVPFSWFKLTGYNHKSPIVYAALSSSSDERIPSSVFGGSGNVTPRVGTDRYLSMKHNQKDSFRLLANAQPCRRSVREEMDNIDVIKSSEAYCHRNDSNSRNNHAVGIHGSELTDQWDVLDRDLKMGMSEKGGNVAWQARNRKREIDYNDHQADDEQGFYRLSMSGNSIRNPTNFLMSAFGAKPNKHRAREYYDDIPDEERIREQMRPNDLTPSNYPK